MCRLSAVLAAVIAAATLSSCGGGHAAHVSGQARVHSSGYRFAIGDVATTDGRYAFVDPYGRVLVYAVTGTSRLVRSIRVPGEAVGSSLTRDGRLLLIANGQGATVVSVAGAETGAPNAVLGTLSPPRNAH